MLTLASCDDYVDIIPKGKTIPTTVDDFQKLLANGSFSTYGSQYAFTDVNFNVPFFEIYSDDYNAPQDPANSAYQTFKNMPMLSNMVSWADYIYEAERLATYAGKALHGKKNHCNRFEAEHAWEFVPLTRENIPACLEMLEAWTKDNAERLDDSIVYEHEAIERAFTHFEALGLEGGVLYADGKLVGFSFGEMTSEDTFDTHVEKADAAMNGAYPMVCRELTRMMCEKHPELKYINREDDMGLEPLRISKLSYKPVYLLKKYMASWIDG